MTILPKKKHSESKKSDSNSNNENRGRIRTGSNWSNQTERNWSNDDFSTDENYRSNTFESRDTNETSGNTKRRHRSPPHRHKYHERQNEETGYNSSDEHDSLAIEPPTEELEVAFEKALKEKKGFTIRKMAQDGACLFRAVADQVYGDQDMHSVVRRHCMDYMTKNADYFSQYVTEDFSSYIVRKRNDHCHGNHIEMQALSEMYNRTIEVYQYSTEPINTFHGSNKCDYEPIRLSYHGNVHYNSVLNPNKPSVGVGLGLSGYKPWGSSLVNDAKKKSEEWHIEQQMLEDKLRATDWEATNEAMEEAVARESYLEWLKDCEKRTRGTRTMPQSTPTATSSTSTSTESKRPNSPHHRERERDRDTENAPPSKSPRHSPSSSPSSPRYESPFETKTPLSKDVVVSKDIGNFNLPQECKPGCSSTVSNPPSPPGAVGGNSTVTKQDYIKYDSAADWEDQSILAAVIAQSQQEYLDSFKRNLTSSLSSSSEDSNPTKS